MDKTWKPIAAGLCSVIASIIGGILISGFLELASCRGDMSSEAPGLLAEAIALVLLAVAYLALVGGFCSIQRKRWRLAFAGSIVACLFFWPVGIAAVILISMSKTEFI